MSATISMEAREFLGRRPVWIIKTARIVLVINALLILALLWCIRYPDIIKAPVTINARGEGEMRISSKAPVRPGQKVRVTVYDAGTGVTGYRDGVVERVMPGLAEGQRLMPGEAMEHRGRPGEQRIVIRLSALGTAYPTEGCIIVGDRRLVSRLLASLHWGRGSR